MGGKANSRCFTHKVKHTESRWIHQQRKGCRYRYRWVRIDSSPLVMCGPHGLKFLKPVELRLPHCASMTPDGWSFALKSSDSSSGTLSSLCPLGLWVLSFIEPGLMALLTLIMSQSPSIPLAL